MEISELGIRNELTRFMDKYVKKGEKWDEDFPYVYVYTEEGKPCAAEFEDSYSWFIRFPGYTCANVLFDKESSKVLEISLIYRDLDEEHKTVFKNPRKLERLLRMKFIGKHLS